MRIGKANPSAGAAGPGDRRPWCRPAEPRRRDPGGGRNRRGDLRPAATVQTPRCRDCAAATSGGTCGRYRTCRPMLALACEPRSAANRAVPRGSGRRKGMRKPAFPVARQRDSDQQTRIRLRPRNLIMGSYKHQLELVGATTLRARPIRFAATSELLADCFVAEDRPPSGRAFLSRRPGMKSAPLSRGDGKNGTKSQTATF